MAVSVDGVAGDDVIVTGAREINTSLSIRSDGVSADCTIRNGTKRQAEKCIVVNTVSGDCVAIGVYQQIEARIIIIYRITRKDIV